MTDKSKQSERQRRYHVRKKAQAMALFAHATEIELAWFGVNRDGEHIAIGYDGQPIDLIVRAGATLPDLPAPETAPVDELATRRQKKVYAPKSWPADKWNMVVVSLREQDFTKDEARKSIEKGKTLDDKQKRHALAIIDAVPDVPDWYDHLPVAEI